jgi:hypothetical protein
MVFEPLLDLGLAEQTEIVGICHGRYIRSRRISGRIVDKRFIKGQWSRPLPGQTAWRVVQGKHVGGRMVEGKYYPWQFVAGEWITDDEFVEGKFVDGRLGPGVWLDYQGDKFLEGSWRSGLFFKGKWDGDVFTDGKTVSHTSYTDKWLPNGTFVRGCWATRPNIHLFGAGM